ncbi:tyrosine-protein phosphatase [Oceanobacillus senegalensis]|uniref:tyrosine-protein phosphatase n=1 Tax=Oceanobacillus senegalensis TaxID=1936063 RepID=UPI000A3101DA|nr:CpsB/CapC family capsule biosynthesis tyrosine phosphatase [Oceanobacillus senegalensis]
MIDIHSHILPGIDDGSKSFEDSLQLAKAAIDEGIQTIIATPHHQNGKYRNEKRDIIQLTKELNEAFQQHDIPLNVLPGQETRLHGEMVEEWRSGKLLTLAEHTKYIFVELPHDHVPRYAKRLLFEIQLEGLIPIVVHPERNVEMMEHPSILYDMVEKGILTQITAASVVGRFGKKTKKRTHQLIENNLTHFIASDAHNTTSRGFFMEKAYSEVEKVHGIQTRFFLMENAALLVDGDTVQRMEPTRMKKKKFLGLF